MALIPAGEIGQIVKNGKITERQYQTVNTDTLDFCWRHNIILTSDWKNPNEEDKKKLEKIRLVKYQIKEKDGTFTKLRYCPECYQTVQYTVKPND